MTTIRCSFCLTPRDPARTAIFFADGATICAQCVDLFHDSLLPGHGRDTAVMATAAWPSGSMGEYIEEQA